MFVPKTEENAVLLLAAAYKLGHDASAVPSTGKGFTASDEIMREAGFLKDEPAAKTADSKSASKKSTAK